MPEPSPDTSRPRRRLARAVLALGAACAVLVPACGGSGGTGGAGAAPGRVEKVLVVGADGLEWSVLRPLLADGRCPNLRRLMQAGAFGRLATLDVTLSPVVWTSIATSRTPPEHGILDFLDPQGREYTSARRACRALWNIADMRGLTTGMFGWFVTYPVEPVRGVAVSGSASAALVDENWKPALVEGWPDQVHPPELTGRVMAIAARAGDEAAVLEVADEKIYRGVPAALLDAEQQKLRRQTLWSIQSDLTFYELASRLMVEHPADLNLVYFGGTDVVGHRYWRQHEPEAYAWQGDSPEADAALADVIPNYYEWFDELLGGLLEAAGPGTTVFVVSDHGMHAIATDAPNEFGTTGHHMDGAPGVIVAAGPGIRREGDLDWFLRTGGLTTLGSVYDVAPTVLALLGLPAARDMAGRAYRPMLEGVALENASLPPVPTYDTGFRAPSIVAMPPEMGENFKEKFGQLGYLGTERPEGTGQIVVPEDDGPR